MLNRAPAPPPYGFDIQLIEGGATLVLSTPEFPCRINDLDHYSTGVPDTFIPGALNLGMHLLLAAGAEPGPSAQPWLFQLPTPKRRAAVHGYRNIKLFAGTIPVIDRGWWNQAVMAGGRCRLVTTTGLLYQAANRDVKPEAIHPYGGHRIVGASIPVEF